MNLPPFHFSMLTSMVNKAKAFLWISNPAADNAIENVTVGFEHDSVYVAARSRNCENGVYNWAIIAQPDGGASIQVRDKDGKSGVSVDLQAAVAVLRRLIEEEKEAAARKLDNENSVTTI
jgi:hypothetical protein